MLRASAAAPLIPRGVHAHCVRRIAAVVLELELHGWCERIAGTTGFHTLAGQCRTGRTAQPATGGERRGLPWQCGRHRQQQCDHQPEQPGTLSCTDSGNRTVQAVHGLATFSGCSVNTAANGDTLTATDTDDFAAEREHWIVQRHGAVLKSVVHRGHAVPLCDTRPVQPGIASNQCNTGSPSRPITNNSTRAVHVTGGPVPSTASAIVVDLTAIAPTARTLLAVYPTGGTRGVSNVNPLPGQVVAVLVEVGIGSGGDINVYNNVGTINIAMDIEGYVDSTSMGMFNPTTPTRICEPAQPQRHPQQPVQRRLARSASARSEGRALVRRLRLREPGSFDRRDRGGLRPPPRSTRRCAPNLAAYPGNLSTPPTVSNVNLEAGQAVANRVIVPVPSGCSGATSPSSSGTVRGNVNVAVDIDGWFGSTVRSSPRCQVQARSVTRDSAAALGLRGSREIAADFPQPQRHRDRPGSRRKAAPMHRRAGANITAVDRPPAPSSPSTRGTWERQMRRISTSPTSTP